MKAYKMQRGEEASFPLPFLHSPPRKHLLCFSRNQFYYLGFNPFLSKGKYSTSFSSEVYVHKGET